MVDSMVQTSVCGIHTGYTPLTDCSQSLRPFSSKVAYFYSLFYLIVSSWQGGNDTANLDLLKRSHEVLLGEKVKVLTIIWRRRLYWYH